MTCSVKEMYTVSVVMLLRTPFRGISVKDLPFIAGVAKNVSRNHTAVFKPAGSDII